MCTLHWVWMDFCDGRGWNFVQYYSRCDPKNLMDLGWFYTEWNGSYCRLELIFPGDECDQAFPYGCPQDMPFLPEVPAGYRCGCGSSESSSASESSTSSPKSPSSPSESSGSSSTENLCDEYWARDFGYGYEGVNGCYHRVGSSLAYAHESGDYVMCRQIWANVNASKRLWGIAVRSTSPALYYLDASTPEGQPGQSARWAYVVGQGNPIGGYVNCGCPKSESSSRSSLSSQSESSQSSATSASSLSTTTRQGTTSSSSVAEQTIVVKNATYACDCIGMESIQNPLTGKSAGVVCRGTFAYDPPPPGGAYEEAKDAHVSKGGLARTESNRGMLFCSDASRLFSAGSGMVVMRISLPESVSNGVYAPLSGQSGRYLTDMVLWAANMGDHYVTPPGLYAAFTPDGIEFTVWTSASKATILGTGDFQAGEEIVLEFGWDADGIGDGNTMVLFGNGQLLGSCSDAIAKESLGPLYGVHEASSSSQDTMAADRIYANFTVMDSPSGKNGLVGVLRRIETHRSPANLPSGMQGGGLRMLSPRSAKILRSAVGLPVSFEGVRGGTSIGDPEFMVAIPVTVNMQATGTTGALRQTEGLDAGAPEEDAVVPEIPEDLPVGIEEVRPEQ